MARVTKYNAAEMTVTFGAVLVSGFAPDTFVSVESDEDAFQKQVGADGEGVRTRTNNNGGFVTMTLMQSSATNDLFSALHNADRLTGAGVGPLLIQDQNGTTLVEAAKAWIRRFPTAEYGREASTREWIIDTTDLVQFHGGNTAL